MKENIRNTKNSRDIIRDLKKIFFFFFAYKMVIITVKNCLNARVHIVTVGNRKLILDKND